MPPPPNANPMLSLRIHGLSSPSPPVASTKALVASSSSQSATTSSDRAWEEEYQQWKKFQQEPKSQQGGARGQQEIWASSSYPSTKSKASSAEKRSSPVSKRPSNGNSYSMAAARSSAKKTLAYHHQRRPVSPCIESKTISFEHADEICGDQGASLNNSSPVPFPSLDTLAEIAEDEDRDEDQEGGGRRRSSSARKLHRSSHSSTAVATSSCVDEVHDDFDDDHADSPIPDHFVKHIQAAFGPATVSSAKQHSNPRPAHPTASSANAVDLYRDVLRVDRSASDRELRTAFFKRGRQVLGSQFLGGGVNGDDDKSTDSAAEAKLQFQAISMAYEILTTPELRSFYDRRGLVSSSLAASSTPRAVVPGNLAAPSNPSPPPSPTFEALKQQLSKNKSERSAPPPFSVSSPSKSTPVSPALRGREGPNAGSELAHAKKKNKPKSRSLSRGRKSAPVGRSRSASRSIRWNEQVEQLVFERSPDELEEMRSGGSGKGGEPDPDAALVESALSVMMGDPPVATQPPKKLRKVKRRVVLEAQELARELEAIHDNQRDGNKDRQNFISYFLDDLEASLDGFEASVEDFWRFAISSTGSSEASHGQPRGATNKSNPGNVRLEPVRKDDGATEKDDQQGCNEGLKDVAIDNEDHGHDDTSIGTEEFMQAAFCVRKESAVSMTSLSSGPRENRPRESPARASSASLRMNLETTPSLDEEAEQELRSSKILGAFELSSRNCDADSRSSSITSGHARAAEDPALNSDRPSVRERVAVLAAAAAAVTSKQAASPQKKPSHSSAGPTHPKPTSRMSRFKRFGLKSKSMTDSSDAAVLLYNDLMKPLPIMSATASGPATARRVDASLKDVTKALFQELTKPPPYGYDDSSASLLPRLAAMEVKRTSKSRSRSCGPSYSRSLLDNNLDHTVREAFDPFRLDDLDVRPLELIYDKKSGELASIDDTATLNTISTISASEATAILRDRLLAKHRAAAVAGKQRPADTRHAHELKPSQVASPVSVQAVDDEGFDVLSGFESQDPDVVRLDRTKGSAMSSLTGHASHFSVQQEHAWRHLCVTTTREVARECSFEKGNPPKGSAFTASPVTNNDQDQDLDLDLESRIMVYMQAFAEGVDRVGLSISNMMSAAVAVPEENVQGVLNVLSKEMDSTK